MAEQALKQYIKCTICQSQIINVTVKNAVCVHDILKVIICKACNDYYHSGEFVKDENGQDEHCRWCADGGKLLICESCPNVFCRKCIRNNLSRKDAQKIFMCDEWLCFQCKPEQLADKHNECEQVISAIKRERAKNAANLKKKRRIVAAFDSQENGDGNSSENTEEAGIAESFLRNELPMLYSWEKDLATVCAALNNIPLLHPSLLQSRMKSENSGAATELKLKVVKKVKSRMARAIAHASKIVKSLSMHEDKLKKQLTNSVAATKNVSSSTSAKESASSDDRGPTAQSTLTSSGKKRKALKKRKERESIRQNLTGKSAVKRLDDEYERAGSDGKSSNNTDTTAKRKEKFMGSVKLEKSRSSSSDIDTDIERMLKDPSVGRHSHDEEDDINDDESDPEEQPSLPPTSSLNEKKVENSRKRKHKRSDDLLISEISFSADEEDAEIAAASDSSESPVFTHGLLLPENDGGDEDGEKSAAELMTANRAAEIELRNAMMNGDDDDDDEDVDQLISDKINGDGKDAAKTDQADNKENGEEKTDVTDRSNDITNANNHVTEVGESSLDEDDGEDADIDVGDDVDDDVDKKKKKYRHPLMKLKVDLSDCEGSASPAANKSEKSTRSKRKSTDDLTSAKKRARRDPAGDRNDDDDVIEGDGGGDGDDAAQVNVVNVDDISSDVDVINDDDVIISDGAAAGDVDGGADATAADELHGSERRKKTGGDVTGGGGDVIDDTQEAADSAAPPDGSSSQNLAPPSLDVTFSDDNDDEGDDVIPPPTTTTKAEVKKEVVSDSDVAIVDGDGNDDDDVSSDDALPVFKRRIKRNIMDHFGADGGHNSSEDFKKPKSKESARAKRLQKRAAQRRNLISDDDEDEEQEEEEDEDRVREIAGSDGAPAGRRNIRKILDDGELSQETQNAEIREKMRRKRMDLIEQEQQEVIVIEDESTPEKKVAAYRLILSKDPLVEVDRTIARVLKSHQVDGVRFLWKNVIESVARANKGKGDGCILAHCMGLGKTLQVVAFLHTVLRNEHLPKLRTALVLCPMGTVSNWTRELRYWTRKSDKQVRVFDLCNYKSNHERRTQLLTWTKRGGVMVLGYGLFRTMIQGKKRGRSKSAHQQFLDSVISCLHKPGPDIVICDEGHVIKNSQTNLSTVVGQIATSRRVVLTGTPMQNNLSEYHCMVSFIKPRLLGSAKEFANRFVNPILNGQHVDSTKTDVHLMKKRSHVLHELLSGCIQRRDVECLRAHLMPKYEYVLHVRLSPLQIRLYEKYMETNKCSDLESRKGCLFQDFNNFMLIVCHPRVFRLQKKQQEIKEERDEMRGFLNDDDEDEEDEESDDASGKEDDDVIDPEKLPSMSVQELKKIVMDGGGNLIACTEKSDLIERARSVLSAKKNRDKKAEDWYESVIPTTSDLCKGVEHGAKMLLLVEILNLAAEVGDKVVVFSQSLLTLDLIEEMLREQTKEREQNVQSRPANTKYWKWYPQTDYYRVDGSTPLEKRKNYIDVFNDPADRRIRLFLLSTRAGGIGINLFGANRAVVFDTSWNPTHDVQSIYRIYRFGQKKPCYIYRLVAQGTMEEKVYDRQIAKQSISFRVIDEQQIERHFTANDLSELYTFKPDRGKTSMKTLTDRPPPKDALLATLMKSMATRDTIVSFHEHDSLLDHKVDEELSEAERRTAWDEYDRERFPPVAADSVLLRMPLATLKELVKLADDELKRNAQMSAKSQEGTMYDMMGRVKLHNREMALATVQNTAARVMLRRLALRDQLDDTRKFLIQKKEQLNYCIKMKTPQVHVPPVSSNPASQQRSTTAQSSSSYPGSAPRGTGHQQQATYHKQPQSTSAAANNPGYKPRAASYRPRAASTYYTAPPPQQQQNPYHMYMGAANHAANQFRSGFAGQPRAAGAYWQPNAANNAQSNAHAYMRAAATAASQFMNNQQRFQPR